MVDIQQLEKQIVEQTKYTEYVNYIIKELQKVITGLIRKKQGIKNKLMRYTVDELNKFKQEAAKIRDVQSRYTEFINKRINANSAIQKSIKSNTASELITARDAVNPELNNSENLINNGLILAEKETRILQNQSKTIDVDIKDLEVLKEYVADFMKSKKVITPEILERINVKIEDIKKTFEQMESIDAIEQKILSQSKQIAEALKATELHLVEMTKVIFKNLKNDEKTPFRETSDFQRMRLAKSSLKNLKV